MLIYTIIILHYYNVDLTFPISVESNSEVWGYRITKEDGMTASYQRS